MGFVLVLVALAGLAVGVTCAIAALAYLSIAQTTRGGAPTGADYEAWMMAALLFEFAPGSGAFLGGVAAAVHALARAKRR